MYCNLIRNINTSKSKKFSSTLSYVHNPVNLPLRPLTVGQLLEETCNKNGDTVGIISCHQNQKLTFNEIIYRADQLAAGLKSIELNYGDRVGIWAPNLIEWYISFMACARAGLTTVAINPLFQHKEIEYCINKVGIKAMISGHIYKKQNYYEILNKVIPNLITNEPGKIKNNNVPSLKSIISIADKELKGTFNYNHILNIANENEIKKIKNEQNKIKCDDSFNIQFTSGTTGKAKAASISHFNLVNNGFFVGKRNELNKKQQKICVQVPLFHAFGTCITISAALNYGSTLVLPSAGYNPDKNLDAIKNEKCTIIHGTPTMYVDLVNRQMERNEDINPEIAVSGGAICSPHLFKRMKKYLKLNKVKSVYGLSETTAVIFQSMEGDDEYKSTCTVGHVSEHVEAKVVDNNGNIVPRGTPGELYVRTYANMLEYWGDEEKTKDTIGNDRWLKTG
ncbi:unnamed protein product [Brassicogethes aeneus]|uniref:Medium-chain acyl-CoA ligase ACSF2, mitochondrial n=1 Tax=Brassicogethes aeneus TaxID=1431903 RepID=A0A9P0BK90_BRAAE|nr:unnamed protein product [Brassicogethes aeneus]